MEERATTPHTKIFHGWWVVATSFLGASVGMGIGGVGIGVFVEPMTDDLGWSRAAMGGVFLIRAIVMAVLGPVLGPLVDKRRGGQILYVSGGFIAGASIMMLSRVDTIWQFYLLFGVGWSIGQLSFGGNVVTGPIVAKWFVRKRGRAMGIYTMGIPVGAILFVPLNAVLVTSFGWETAWVILGVATWILTIPLAAFTMRRQPEDLGLHPDGVSNEAFKRAEHERSLLSGTAAILHRVDWTLSQALHTPTLYILLASFLFMGMAMGIFTIHQVPAITDKGYSLGIASAVSVALSVCSLIVKPSVGFLTERFAPRYLASLCFGLGAAGVVVLGLADTMFLLFLFAVLYGFGAGASAVFQNVIWADYYGRRHLGAIRGMIAPITAMGGGISPFIAGWMFDKYGSYDTILVTMGIGAFIASGLMLLARPPRAQLEEYEPVTEAEIP
jgi:MFS family permease